jgi:Pyruvate/2-oxoacid:ferredoxin oxidoreductase delta subunit
VPGLAIKDGTVQVGANMMTGFAGIFAGGDMVPSERTGDGWSGSRQEGRAPYQRLAFRHRVRTAAEARAGHLRQAQSLVLQRRAENGASDARSRTPQVDFDEVVSGLDEHNALFEARRCLSCGNCFECDNCYGVCPDNAVIKLGPGKRFEFNFDYCKGCGHLRVRMSVRRDQDGFRSRPEKSGRPQLAGVDGKER